MASLPSGGVSLVIAGAGTGKTKTLVEKVNNVIAAATARPENMLILTFSRKAADEIKERIKSHTGDSAEKISAGTFHSFCLRLLRENQDEFIKAFSFDRFPDILDEDKREELKLSLIKDSLDKFLGLPVRVIYGLSENMDSLDKKTGKKLKQLGIISHLFSLNKRFSDFKRDRGLLDFGDMMDYAIKMLEGNKSIRDRVQRKYKYIFVDEFQDTSEDNFQLLKLLINDNDPSLFMVGDDWQSIYGFRGSKIDYIIKARRYFPGLEIYKLKVNYRSRKEIVKLSNAYIRNNKYKTRKKLKSHKGRGGAVKDYIVNGRDQEIRLIRDIIQNGAGDFKDIAVLYRNNWQGDIISKGLQDIDASVKEKLKLMTIHSSKGLEFDRVIIAGISDEIIPDQSNDIEEERRLLYVALTRAKERLYIIHHEQPDHRLALFADELGFKAG